jgi:DNA-binding transcriptional MerR regulator
MKHAAAAQSRLTIADMARRLKLPESTTRYYCKRFAAHLPHEGDGRTRRYLPEAVDILQAIAQGMRENKNALAVDVALRSTSVVRPTTPVLSGGMGDGATMSMQIMQFMERQTEALQQIASAMTLFASAKEAERALVSAAGADVNALRHEVDTLKGALQVKDESHKQHIAQVRGWLARFSEALAKRPV